MASTPQPVKFLVNDSSFITFFPQQNVNGESPGDLEWVRDSLFPPAPAPVRAPIQGYRPDPHVGSCGFAVEEAATIRRSAVSSPEKQ
jgi:hypothetical protein